MSIIIINRSRVQKQLEVIDDPSTDIYARLTPQQKEVVELVRLHPHTETFNEDWKLLLDICKSLE